MFRVSVFNYAKENCKIEILYGCNNSYFTKYTRKKKCAQHIGYEALSNTTGILLRNLLYYETDTKINNKKIYIL